MLELDMPLQTGSEILGAIRDYIWGPLMALIAWGWSHTHKRIDGVNAQADGKHKDLREYVDKEVGATNQELTRQRDVAAKIFDKLEDMVKRSDDRHFEQLRRQADSQREILQTIHNGLAGKADK